MGDEIGDLIAVEVGNTRCAMGLFRGTRAAGEAARVPAADAAGLARALEGLREEAPGAAIVLAGVNPSALDAVERAARGAVARGGAGGNVRVLRLGRDAAIPIRRALDDDTTVGQDRLLCALAAYAVSEQACVVIDAGTAVTVDFVDGEGVFQGGVIAPGASMMLRALHEQTASLPSLSFEVPDPARGPFGKDTAHAMRLGVVNAIRGLVRATVERYADAFGAYPQIVATGGDAGALFAEDDLVENIVTDLQLLGIAHACRILAGGGDERPMPPTGRRGLDALEDDEA